MPGAADRRPSTRNLIDLQLTPLRSFVVLSQLKSYTQAAEELNYSEPGIYLQIKNLEKFLGVRLVRRHGKQILLTTAGSRLVFPATQLLADADLLLQTARGLQGRVAVVSGANTAVALLMPLIATFQLGFPDLHVELSTLDSEGMIRGVANGTFDLGVGGFAGSGALMEIRAHRLILIPWKRDNWCVFGPTRPDRLLRHASSLSAVRVFHMQGVSWTPRTTRVETYISQRLGCPVELVEVDGVELVRGAIVNGLGLGILPASAEGVYSEGIARISDLGDEGRLVLRLLHRRPRELTEPVRQFLSAIIRARHHSPSLR